MPAVGIGIGGHIGSIEELARAAEDGGYESVWVAADPDPDRRHGAKATRRTTEGPPQGSPSVSRGCVDHAFRLGLFSFFGFFALTTGQSSYSASRM